MELCGTQPKSRTLLEGAFFTNNSFSLVKPKNVTTLQYSHCLGQNVLAALTPREQLEDASSIVRGRVSDTLTSDVPQL